MTRKKRLTRPTWPALGCVLTILACGGDDADAESAGPSLAQKPYVAASFASLEGQDTTGESLPNTNNYAPMLTPEQDGELVAPEFGFAEDYWVCGETIWGSWPGVLFRGTRSGSAISLDTGFDFSEHGVEDTKFSNTVFVTPIKAYTSKSATELVVWNPRQMKVDGAITLQGVDDRDGLHAVEGQSDRATLVFGGKVYRSVYWTNDDGSVLSEQSQIVVFDAATDQQVALITAACAGLDFATQGDGDKIYFSNWTNTVGVHFVHAGPPSCFVEIDAATDTLTSVTRFRDVTGGREAAALQAAGAHTFLLSVFDDERAEATSATDAALLAGTANWQVWSYDRDTGAALPITEVDWNTGEIYYATPDTQLYMLVPGEDHAVTTAYAVSGAMAHKAYQLEGLSRRLFKFRNLGAKCPSANDCARIRRCGM